MTSSIGIRALAALRNLLVLPRGFTRVLGVSVLITLMAAGPASVRAAHRTQRHAPPRAHASVINGDVAEQGEFPYMAFVVFDNGSEGNLCSGTVVSSNVILTAAHCVMNQTFTVLRNPSNFAVVTGNVDWASPERTVSSVSRVAVDPNLTWLVPSYISVRGDAAVLELAAPISAPPVSLATTQTWTAGTPVVMAGWGRTTSNGESPKSLHVGESVVQGNSYCASKFSRFESSASLCIVDYPDYRYATCHGDSGGPLLMAAPGTGGVLEIGITSIGQTECPTESPQYYTRADYVAAWVGQKVTEWAPPPSTAPAAPASPSSSAPAPPRQAAPSSSREGLYIPPALTRSKATRYAREALRKVFHASFSQRRVRVTCYRTSERFQQCSVAWRHAHIRYSGHLIVFLHVVAGKAAWKARYAISWTNSRCIRPVSRSKGTCPKHRLSDFIDQQEVEHAR